MNEIVNEYLRIIYPNFERLSEEERLQFEKDKAFLLAYKNEFEACCKKYEGSRAKFGERKFFLGVLEICKEEYDLETIIINYLGGINGMLEGNSYITNNYDEFLNLMRYERQQEQAIRGVEVDKTPIDLLKVFLLTEKFLMQVDPSGEMVKEFKKMRAEKRITLLFPDDNKGKSIYKYGTINFAFSGTIDTAPDLVHEFMHHWVETKGNPNLDSVGHTMFNEFEPIYYENAFIRFMNNIGLLKKGENPIRAKRLKHQNEMDPDYCLLMLFELYKLRLENKTVNKDSIIDTLQKYYPEITDREELWNKLSRTLCKFHSKHRISKDIMTGGTMYRLGTALALKTNLKPETVQSVYKLAPFIQGRAQDGEFMEHYKKMRIELASERTSAELDSDDDL